jgi:hypothetical protein
LSEALPKKRRRTEVSAPPIGSSGAIGRHDFNLKKSMLFRIAGAAGLINKSSGEGTRQGGRMRRPLIVGMLLLCSAPSAQVRTITPPDVLSLPMQFEWRREGPADVCNKQCRVWISAIGSITEDTQRDFENFAQDPNVRGAVMVFDSEGGSVLGAISLGRSIRRFGMTTTVGKTSLLPGTPKNDPRATLSFDAYCESMCTFALLAGTRRYVPAEAHVLVHQIWLGDRRKNALTASYSAEDLVLMQRDIGRLAQYTVEMGADIDLLETALKIPPWAPMHTLSQNEVARMHLSTVDTLYDEVTPEVATKAAPVTSAAIVAARPITINERGWALVEVSGTPAKDPTNFCSPVGIIQGGALRRDSTHGSYPIGSPTSDWTRTFSGRIHSDEPRRP